MKRIYLKKVKILTRRHLGTAICVGTLFILCLIMYTSISLLQPKPEPKSPLRDDGVETLADQTSREPLKAGVAVILFSPNPLKPYNLNSSIPRTHILDETIKAAVGNKREGFFVEVGAGDGQTRSLTLALEVDFKWTGLLLEADDAQALTLLSTYRRAYLSHECISFNYSTFTGRFVSDGLLGSRILMPNETGKGLNVTMKKCYPLQSFLNAIRSKNLDFLGIDINGNELELLRTLPLDKMNISVIVSRCKGTESDLLKYETLLRKQKYYLVTKVIGYDYLVFKKWTKNKRVLNTLDVSAS